MNLKTTLLTAMALVAFVGLAQPASACLVCNPKVTYMPTGTLIHVSTVESGPAVGYVGLVHIDVDGTGFDLAGYGATNPCQYYNSAFVSGVHCSVLSSTAVYGATRGGPEICIDWAFLGVDITHSSPDGYDVHTDKAVFVDTGCLGVST